MKNLFKKIVMFALSLLSLLAIVGTIVPEFIDFGDTITGLLVATTPVAGTVTHESVESNAPNHLERDISNIVTKVRPDEFPLDTMIRNIRKAEKAISPKVEYETVTYRGRQAALTATFTAAGGAGDEAAALEVDAANIFAVDDTVLVPSVNGADSKPLRLLVTAVDWDAGTITTKALNSPTVDTFRVPTITSGTEIKRMGNAKNETDSITDIITQVPIQDYNYVQTEMAFLERTQFEAKTQSYSGYGYRDKMEQKIYDFRSNLSASFWGGVKSKTPVGSDYHYTSDGVSQKVTQSVDFGTGGGTVDPSAADVIDLLEETFSGNAGSDERVMFAGKKALTGLMKISLQKEQMAMETEVKWGVQVYELVNNFGRLYIKHDKMLDQLGYENNAFVLDLNHVVKHDFEPMHSKKLNPDEAGLRRVQDAVRVLESSCLTVRYPDVHKIWTPTA